MNTLPLASGTPIGDYRAELGETPVWCPRSQSLLWVDILNHRLLRYWPGQDRAIDIRPLPIFTSAVLLTDRAESFLVVSQQGIFVYDYTHQTQKLICDYPDDSNQTRTNEAAIAPDGSLWFSTMELNALHPVGNWYRYTSGSAQPSLLLSGVKIPNTLIWSSGKVWFSDSALSSFFSADYFPNDDRPLSDIDIYPLPETTPDGSALSTQQILINACWGDSRLACYQLGAGGPRHIKDIALPVTQPSNCVFGGKKLSELYITSAKTGLTSGSSLEGALLHIDIGCSGPEPDEFKL